jgi:hypothetical protein
MGMSQGGRLSRTLQWPNACSNGNEIGGRVEEGWDDQCCGSGNGSGSGSRSGSGSGSAGSSSFLVKAEAEAETEAPKNMPLPLPLCYKVAVRILVDFC